MGAGPGRPISSWAHRRRAARNLLCLQLNRYTETLVRDFTYSDLISGQHFTADNRKHDKRNSSRGFHLLCWLWPSARRRTAQRFVLGDPTIAGSSRSNLECGPARFLLPHALAAAARGMQSTAAADGTVKTNTAPPPRFVSNQIAPPCASTMVRQIERPTPMPLALLVTKG